jgi:hypothetical protein
MNTGEIPREQWLRLLDDFSKKHEGWMTTLEVIDSDLGDQIEGELPLVGISADLKDHENRIEVILRRGIEDHVTHIINAPKRLWIKAPDIPTHEAVKVESEDGATTLVSFNHIESPDHLLPDDQR